MKRAHLLWVLALLVFGASPAVAGAPSGGANFTGTYVATLPERAEIFQLHRDGNLEITLSDQVTSGAGGFTFSDSLGTWRMTGPRTLFARVVNLNFDVTGPAATFSGTAVVEYKLQFAEDYRSFSATCQGKIFPPGQEPFSSSSTPVTTFDCSYLHGYFHKRVPIK
jgi:hypothetical protein